MNTNAFGVYKTFVLLSKGNFFSIRIPFASSYVQPMTTCHITIGRKEFQIWDDRVNPAWHMPLPLLEVFWLRICKIHVSIRQQVAHLPLRWISALSCQGERRTIFSATVCLELYVLLSKYMFPPRILFICQRALRGFQNISMTLCCNFWPCNFFYKIPNPNTNTCKWHNSTFDLFVKHWKYSNLSDIHVCLNFNCNQYSWGMTCKYAPPSWPSKVRRLQDRSFAIALYIILRLEAFEDKQNKNSRFKSLLLVSMSCFGTQFKMRHLKCEYYFVLFAIYSVL